VLKAARSKPRKEIVDHWFKCDGLATSLCGYGRVC
jgi:hypothetical protein